MDIELSPEEEKAIRSLRRLAKTWPKTLWIFCNGMSDISVLKVGDDGQRVMTASGSIDQGRIVGDARIPNEGGDW